MYAQNSILAADSEHIKTVYKFERNFRIHKPNKEDWSNGRVNIDYYSHVYFADGSVKKSGSGYGAFYARTNRIIVGHCGKHAKTTQTELAAIHTCCVDAIKHGLKGSICIYNDSLGALNALDNPIIRGKLVLECVQLLEQLAQTNNVHVIWIPSHNGIYGNDTADKIAKYGATIPVCGPEPHIALDTAMAKKYNEQWLAQQIQIAWSSYRRDTHAKQFLAKANNDISDQILNMTKANIRITIGLITGHCGLNSHLARIGIRNDPDCDLCGRDSETAIHILCDCQSLSHIRRKYFAKEVVEPSEWSKKNTNQFALFYKDCSEYSNHLARVFK